MNLKLAAQKETYCDLVRRIIDVAIQDAIKPRSVEKNEIEDVKKEARMFLYDAKHTEGYANILFRFAGISPSKVYDMVELAIKTNREPWLKTTYCQCGEKLKKPTSKKCPECNKKARKKVHSERVELYGLGYSDEKMAAILKTTSSAICSWRYKHNLPRNKEMVKKEVKAYINQ